MRIIYCLALVFFLFSTGCRLKKQTINDDHIAKQSTFQTSDEKQKGTNFSQLIVDGSKTTKKDSAFISVTERDDIEYDYPTPLVGSPSKIIRHIEKVTNFKNGTSSTSQNAIKAFVNADLEKSEKKTAADLTKTKESSHFSSSLTSSPIYWIWILGIMIVLIAIYLIKKYNVINLAKTVVAKII